MPLNAPDFSVDLFVRGLTNLKSILQKGEAHAAAHAIDPGELLHAKLADDMYDLATQAHWAADGSKLALGRLLGETAPPPNVPEATTFADLYARIDEAIAYLRGLDAKAIEAGVEGSVVLPTRGGPKTFGGAQFLGDFAIPNFYFHMTSAYGILRNRGVALGKGDFMGALG